MMRTLLIMAVLVLFLPGLAGASKLPMSGQANVSFVQGKVNYTQKNRKVRLKQGYKVSAPGDLVLGEDARLELELADGSVLRFSAGTECNLVSAVASGMKRDVRVDVALGDCWASVKNFLGQNSTFAVNSPTAVAGVSGTRYRVHVDASRASSYLVYDGSIKVGYRPVSSGYSTDKNFSGVKEVGGPQEVQGPGEISMQDWILIVKSGYRFDVSPDGAFYRPVRFDREKDLQDPWVRWNLNRDEKTGFISTDE